MRKTCFLFGFLLLSAPAWGGDVYSFTLERHEGVREELKKGRVLTDGARYRAELDAEESPREWDVLISKGMGESEIGLALSARTYYELKKPDPSQPSFVALWLYSWRQKKTASNVRVETRDPSEPETVSGLSTRRRETKITYDLKVQHVAETLSGHVTIEEIFWMAEDRALPVPGFLHLNILTGLPEVDKPFAEARSRLRGLPVKSQVTVEIDVGGNSVPQTYLLTSTLYDLKAAETNASLFEVPSGFRYEQPVILAPKM